jgi:predicted dehydrogenase
LGDAGRRNLKSLSAAGAEVVAVHDKRGKVMSSIEVEFGQKIAYCGNVRELLSNDIELVVVATPDDDHLESAKASLKAGKYVFIEKPIATKFRDLLEFEQLNREYPEKILFSEKYSFANPVKAALRNRKELGPLLCGNTSYLMWNCDRIMGGGKWRTEGPYNPCAGGLSHNFMTALLFAGSPISRVRSNGKVLAYSELNRYGGYDTMEGTLEFADGQQLGWLVCLGIRGLSSPYKHRTVIHTFQFKDGALAYGPDPDSDRLIINGQRVDFPAEPDVEGWGDYNIGLYTNMHRDLLAGFQSRKTLHNISQGINVAYACNLAFRSSKSGGEWLEVPY